MPSRPSFTSRSSASACTLASAASSTPRTEISSGSPSVPQSSAELVRSVGDNIFAHLLQPLQLRYVMQDGESAASGWHVEGRRLHFKGPGVGGGQAEAKAPKLAARKDRAKQLAQAGI